MARSGDSGPMKARHTDPDACWLDLFALGTGERISHVLELDTDTGLIRRHPVDAKGDLIVPEHGDQLPIVTERRHFRVMDARTDTEVGRTALGFLGAPP